LTFDACDSDYDTWLRLLSADLATEICGCDDCGPCGTRTVLECQVNAGSYVLAVGGFRRSEGSFSVMSTCNTPVMECDNFYDGTTVGAVSRTDRMQVIIFTSFLSQRLPILHSIHVIQVMILGLVFIMILLMVLLHVLVMIVVVAVFRLFSHAPYCLETTSYPSVDFQPAKEIIKLLLPAIPSSLYIDLAAIRIFNTPLTSFHMVNK